MTPNPPPADADLMGLAERCEKAEGPEAELGREVLIACGWSKTSVGYFLGPLYGWTSPDRATYFQDDQFRQHDPTRSLDAALTLVPEGWNWSAGSCSIDGFAPAEASVYPKQQPFLVDLDIETEAATPALALCAAALRARSASYE